MAGLEATGGRKMAGGGEEMMKQQDDVRDGKLKIGAGALATGLGREGGETLEKAGAANTGRSLVLADGTPSM